MALPPAGEKNTWGKKRGKKGYFSPCDVVFWLHGGAGKGHGESGGIRKMFLLPNAPRRQLVVWDPEVTGSG